MTTRRASLALATLVISVTACDGLDSSHPPRSASGVAQAVASVQTQPDGRTVEQSNIVERLKRDNAPGSIKHLYVISAYSGDVLIYSTVRGKVTSSGKRLTPETIFAGDARDIRAYGVPIALNGTTQLTGEVLQDDGTYGTSVPYLYWFDTRGVYHQHYVEGGQIVHITDQPIRVGRVILNMELTRDEAPTPTAGTPR